MYRFILTVAVLCVTSPALAWNNLGHEVVAEIAWRQLDPSTRQQIVDVLRRHPRFDTDFQSKMEDAAQSGDKSVQDHWIFLHAATWPDQIRKNRQYDRPTWHYIDLPYFLSTSDRRALIRKLPVNISMVYPGRTDRGHYNVIQAIAYSRDVLASKAGPDVKAIAYCWLFHLVGDLHQPLHSTALFSVDQFPEGDKGGNEIPLTHGRNLHALWDGLLGRQYYMKDVERAMAKLPDRQDCDVWESATKEMDPREWAKESHELAKSFVYDKVILDAVRATPPGQKVDPITLTGAYLKEAGHQARLRIIAAGVRLAGVLTDTHDQVH